MRLTKKIKYQKPVVTNILLDKDQAVLQVCRLGGAYFGWGGQANVIKCNGVGGPGGNASVCFTAVKGHSSAAGMGSPVSYSAQPS